MTDSPETNRLSIGAVSEATGIPATTLRTWERRYGFPAPDRTDAGHRRYRPEVVDRLRLTARAVDAGHRASDVVGLSVDALSELLAETEAETETDDGADPDESPVADPSHDLEDDDWLHHWIRAAAALEDSTLTRYFRTAWNRLGALSFLQHRAVPFLEHIGEAWARDQLAVAHEHHASEQLREFLTDQWRPLSADATGPTVVLATPENELHAIGLHLVAVVFGLANWQVVYVGANTPADDIAVAADAADADAAAVGIAESYDPDRARAFLESVRDELPPDVEMLAGGAGIPGEIEGILWIHDLEKLHQWADSRA